MAANPFAAVHDPTIVIVPAPIATALVADAVMLPVTLRVAINGVALEPEIVTAVDDGVACAVTSPITLITPPPCMIVLPFAEPAAGFMFPPIVNTPVEFVRNAAAYWPAPPAWVVPVTVRVPLPLW
jgi:hypothetical protein